MNQRDVYNNTYTYTILITVYLQFFVAVNVFIQINFNQITGLNLFYPDDFSLICVTHLKAGLKAHTFLTEEELT